MEGRGHPGSGIRILLVEDDRDFAESLTDVLVSEGHEVTTVFSGEEGLAAFRRHSFDVALLDVKLPAINGVDTFLEMKRMKPESGCRFIVITGYSIEELLATAVEKGVCAVFEKPLDMDALLARIATIGSGGIVLVGDDDPNSGPTIENLLMDCGYQVYLARDGQEALDIGTRRDVDLLILDLRLPLLNGLQVYDELKRRGRRIPTIIISAYLDDETEAVRVLGAKAGNCILRKPVDPGLLLEVAQRLLEVG